MDRRRFLKVTGVLLGAAGSGGVLAACAGDRPVPDGPPTLNVIDASFETLTGDARRYAFGLTTARDNVPVEDADLEVYTRTLEGEVTGGPYPARYHAQAGSGLGVYLTQLHLPAPGPVEVAVVAGRDHGLRVINVVRPEDSSLPVPGGAAIHTPTPTFDGDLGLAELCTRQPDCSMHDLSLDAALDAGRPVALMFATPRYCRTAVCGPSVDTLEELRHARDWGEVAFVHCEIYSDAGETVAEPVRAWGLPSEPWLFTIDRTGVVVERVDGVMIGEELRDMLERIA